MEEKQRAARRTRLASAAVIAAGCMWGSMGIWVRRCTQAGLDSMQILALRAGVATALLTLFLLIYNRKLLRVRLKDLWCFFGTGVCSITFFGYCYNRTIVLSSLSVAAILLYTAPVFVMILSRVLFRELLSAKKIAALFLAFAGCVCVTGVLGGSAQVRTAGILTGLGSGFGYALYSIFGRFALERKYHPFTITLYTFAFALAATLLLTDWGPILSFVTERPSSLLYGLGYGVVTSVLPYILYTFGLSFVDNSRASIMATVEPVVATLIGVFWFREAMTLQSAVGVALVLAALVLLGREE